MDRMCFVTFSVGNVYSLAAISGYSPRSASSYSFQVLLLLVCVDLEEVMYSWKIWLIDGRLGRRCM